MRKLFNKTTAYLVLIILLAGGLRLARAMQEERYSVDAYIYFQMAKDWAYHGAAYTFKYNSHNTPPALPWLMAMGYNFGLSPEKTGLLAGIILGSLIPLAAFWIALNLFPVTKKENESFLIGGKHAYALMAAFLVAIHPFFIRISVSCLREILYLPLLTFAVAFAISAIHNKSLWRCGVFAILSAFAALSRREGILIIMVFMVWQAIEIFAEHKNFKKVIAHKILTVVTVAVIFISIMLPVLYSLQKSCPGWSPYALWNISEDLYDN